MLFGCGKVLAFNSRDRTDPSVGAICRGNDAPEERKRIRGGADDDDEDAFRAVRWLEQRLDLGI